MSLAALAFALLICLAVNTDNPLLHWGHETVLTFSSNPQLWVESRVLHMNYACLDARVLNNDSAIIIETIEKTIPDGSIIRQQEEETWSGRSPACPANLTTMHMEGTFTTMSWSPKVHSHVLHNMVNCVCMCVFVHRYLIRRLQYFHKDNFSGYASEEVACSQLKFGLKVSKSAD